MRLGAEVFEELLSRMPEVFARGPRVPRGFLFEHAVWKFGRASVELSWHVRLHANYMLKVVHLGQELLGLHLLLACQGLG